MFKIGDWPKPARIGNKRGDVFHKDNARPRRSIVHRQKFREIVRDIFVAHTI